MLKIYALDMLKNKYPSHAKYRHTRPAGKSHHSPTKIRLFGHAKNKNHNQARK